eukprot:TRINITY_DN67271_c0_g1_i1.p1 TRINITY_DN67271_c0_g1~~TRINITY_DN67271_c0_g1_i1.p1  ORF type:complete len:761 (-),score=132.66 TRINITY_DN67271_c0_g1_i1:323-2605(-)
MVSLMDSSPAADHGGDKGGQSCLTTPSQRVLAGADCHKELASAIARAAVPHSKAGVAVVPPPPPSRSPPRPVNLARLAKLLREGCQATSWDNVFATASAIGEFARALGGVGPVDSALDGAARAEACLERLFGNGLAACIPEEHGRLLPPALEDIAVAVSCTLVAFVAASDECNNNGRDKAVANGTCSATSLPKATAAVISVCAAVSELLVYLGARLAASLLSYDLSGPRKGEVRQGNSGILSALLSAATAASHPSRPAAPKCFLVLRARRAAAELLTALLEESPKDLRVEREIALLGVASEPAATRLVDALVRECPDPKLHEAFLEILWRGLRRCNCAVATPGKATIEGQTEGSGGVTSVGDATRSSDTAAARHFASLVGNAAYQKVQSLTAQELLDWGLDMALQLSRAQCSLIGLAECVITWGCLRVRHGTVTFSAYGFEVIGHLSDDASEGDLSFEIPWSCARLLDLARPLETVMQSDGVSLYFFCNLEAILTLGTLTAQAAALVGSGDAILEIQSQSKDQNVMDKVRQLCDVFHCNDSDDVRKEMDLESFEFVPMKRPSAASCFADVGDFASTNIEGSKEKCLVLRKPASNVSVAGIPQEREGQNPMQESSSRGLMRRPAAAAAPAASSAQLRAKGSSKGGIKERKGNDCAAAPNVRAPRTSDAPKSPSTKIKVAAKASPKPKAKREAGASKAPQAHPKAKAKAKPESTPRSQNKPRNTSHKDTVRVAEAKAAPASRGVASSGRVATETRKRPAGSY